VYGWPPCLLSPSDAMQLAILPALPVVPEGTSAQIVCLVPGTD